MLKDLLCTGDLSARDFADLVELASALEPGARRPLRNAMAGEMLAIYLTEPAPETVRTWSAAAALLGAGTVVLGPDEFQRGRGATLADIARLASLYASVVVAVTGDVDLRRLAAAATVPVTDGRNRGDDPCSGLAEALARRSRCPVLDGPRLVEVSDADRARGTGLDADVLAVAGIDLVDLATPAPVAPPRGHRVLYGPSGTAVLTAVDQPTARRAAPTAATPTPTCTCSPATRRAEHRVHAAAAILLALHRRELTGR